MTALFPYQETGRDFLVAKGRCLLADEPGLGKSAQAITAAAKLKAEYVEVVCPASVVPAWAREIEKFDPYAARGGREWKVMSYDSLLRKNAAADRWVDVLILDEAHYLKTRTAKRTKAVFGVNGRAACASYVFCLTGTPAPNNPSEMWPMLHAIMPGAIDSAVDGAPRPFSYWTFVNKFCKTRDNGFGVEIVGGKNLDELKRRISPFILRRKKDEVLEDLPPIRFDTLALPGELRIPADCAEDVRVVDEALARGGATELRKIATHVAKLRRLTGLAKVQAARAWIEDQLADGVNKLVVFAHHRDVIQELSRTNAEGVVLTGSTPANARGAVVDRFQNDPSCKLFIGQIQAAGTGITLTAASRVLFVESSWVPTENEQAAMRVHRIGQRNACIVRFAMLAGSIDEDIQRACMRKTEDIRKLFG